MGNDASTYHFPPPSSSALLFYCKTQSLGSANVFDAFALFLSIISANVGLNHASAQESNSCLSGRSTLFHRLSIFAVTRLTGAELCCYNILLHCPSHLLKCLQQALRLLFLTMKVIHQGDSLHSQHPLGKIVIVLDLGCIIWIFHTKVITKCDGGWHLLSSGNGINARDGILRHRKRCPWETMNALTDGGKTEKMSFVCYSCVCTTCTPNLMRTWWL